MASRGNGGHHAGTKRDCEAAQDLEQEPEKLLISNNFSAVGRVGLEPTTYGLKVAYMPSQVCQRVTSIDVLSARPFRGRPLVSFVVASLRHRGPTPAPRARLTRRRRRPWLFQELPIHPKLADLDPQPVQLRPFIDIQRARRVIKPRPFDRDPTARAVAH
jgi:hypothetical protein